MKRRDGFIALTEPNEIFVFGSNRGGAHNAGAAKFALDHYGAVYGQGHGLQGRSYAINTMSGIEELKRCIGLFIEDAKSMNGKVFIVTPIGCGIAGYSADEIAPMFRDVPENVILPEEFLK